MTSFIKFNLHKSFIISAIKNQSTGLAKALTEAVMNSVDAGASQINIQLSLSEDGENVRFSIADNGKGLTKADIYKNFKTFGVPHADGDSLYGVHRMGRGQLMAVAKTSWRTNKYHLSVDLRECIKTGDADKMCFSLDTVEQKVKGCVIEGETYANQLHWDERDIETLTERLQGLCLWVPVPIYVNNELINKNIQQEIINHGVLHYEDDYAHYFLDTTADAIKVYNLGVCVRDLKLPLLMLGGYVVTKQRLMLTHSRDQVHSECPVYEALINAQFKLNKYIQCDCALGLSFNDHSLSMALFNAAYWGDCDELHASVIKKLVEAPLFTNNSLSRVSLKSIANYDRIMVRHKYSSDNASLYERIEHLEQAYTLVFDGVLERTRMMLDQYTFNDNSSHLEHLILSLKNILIKYSSLFPDSSFSLGKLELFYEDPTDEKYQEISCVYSSEMIGTLSDDVLSLYTNLTYANKLIQDAQYFNNDLELCLGDCDNHDVLAWFQQDKVVLNLKHPNFLSALQGSKGFMVLIHEYCHDRDGLRGSDHDYHFYQAFHNAIQSQSINSALKAFLQNEDV